MPKGYYIRKPVPPRDTRPPPFAMVVRVIIAIIAVVWLISLLLPFSGHTYLLR